MSAWHIKKAQAIAYYPNPLLAEAKIQPFGFRMEDEAFLLVMSTVCLKGTI